MKSIKTMLDVICKVCSGKRVKDGKKCSACDGCGKKASQKKTLVTK